MFTRPLCGLQLYCFLALRNDICDTAYTHIATLRRDFSCICRQPHLAPCNLGACGTSFPCGYARLQLPLLPTLPLPLAQGFRP